MNVRGLKLLSVVACGAGALVLVSCGGGGGKAVDADDWVDDVCDLALDYDDESNDIFEQIADVDPGDRGAKDDFVAAFEDLSKSQKKLAKDFDKLGYPDVKQGKAIAQAFKDNLKENQKLIDGVIKEMKKIDARDFEDEYADLFEDIEDPDLREAIEDAGGDSDDIIDLIDDNDDCSVVLFNN